jgi:hypothetical protein
LKAAFEQIFEERLAFGHLDIAFQPPGELVAVDVHGRVRERDLFVGR